MDIINKNDSVESSEDTGPLNNIHTKAKAKLFRSYERFKKICLSLSRVLRFVHTGSLSLYLFWFFWGWLILFLLLKAKG